MSDKQRKVFETTPEYFKAMQIDMPTTPKNNGEINGGYDGNDKQWAIVVYSIAEALGDLCERQMIQWLLHH